MNTFLVILIIFVLATACAYARHLGLKPKHPAIRDDWDCADNTNPANGIVYEAAHPRFDENGNHI